MKTEEILILSVIININAHVVSGRWKDSLVHMLLQFVVLEGITLFSVINLVYSTVMYKQQYNDGFSPLHHVGFWLEVDWSIQA